MHNCQSETILDILWQMMMEWNHKEAETFHQLQKVEDDKLLGGWWWGDGRILFAMAISYIVVFL